MMYPVEGSHVTLRTLSNTENAPSPHPRHAKLTNLDAERALGWQANVRRREGVKAGDEKTRMS
jgi:hypothetical protein